MLTLTRSQIFALAALIILPTAFAFIIGYGWEATFIPTFWSTTAIIAPTVAGVIVWFGCFIHVIEKPIR